MTHRCGSGTATEVGWYKPKEVTNRKWSIHTVAPSYCCKRHQQKQKQAGRARAGLPLAYDSGGSTWDDQPLPRTLPVEGAHGWQRRQWQQQQQKCQRGHKGSLPASPYVLVATVAQAV